jgi:hypothetical protein
MSNKTIHVEPTSAENQNGIHPCLLQWNVSAGGDHDRSNRVCGHIVPNTCTVKSLLLPKNTVKGHDKGGFLL